MADYATLKKGGFMRQKQKNHFSLRLRVVGGNLTAKQLETIAKVSEEYGNGSVHLTSRQSVEIPFIRLEQIEAVKQALAKGNVEPGVCGPRVRTVTACQGKAICPSGCIDTYALAKELDDRYYARELPHKFKFGVTGCQNNCLKAEENDVGIKGGIRVRWKEEACIQCGVCVKTCRTGAITLEAGKIVIAKDTCNYCGRCAKACPVDAYEEQEGYIVSFGGTFGNRIHRGETILPFIDKHDDVIKVCDAAISFFENHALAGERFKYTIDRVGKEKFAKEIKESIGTSPVDEISFDDEIDITDVVCPITFVKAKVALENMNAGEILSIRLKDGEPVQNVPRSLKEEGHQVIKLIENEDGTYNLFVKKAEE